jgi:hypothetical protein
MIRRLVIAGCIVGALAGGAAAAGASTTAPNHAPRQELCVVLGGDSNQAFCVNWTQLPTTR